MKMILLIASFVLSILINEVFFAFIIRYPKNDIEKEVFGLTGTGTISYLYRCYSEYKNFEDNEISKGETFKRNNIGLHGVDVDLNNNNFVFLLGNSYVEASQYEPSITSAGIFNNLLNKNSQVMNLGESGYHPYNLYFKNEYYYNIYKPQVIFLILDETYNQWIIKPNEKLSFDIPEGFGTDITTNRNKILLFFKSNLSFLNLILCDDNITGIKNILKFNKNVNNNINNNESFDDEPYINRFNDEKYYKSVSNEVLSVITEFQIKYSGKFILISIIDNEHVNKNLEEFCKLKNINYDYKPLNNEKFKTKGIGHLNIEGNKLLGELLFSSFQKYKNSSN